MKLKLLIFVCLTVLVVMSGCQHSKKAPIESISDLNSPEMSIIVGTGSVADYAARKVFTEANFLDGISIADCCQVVEAGKADAFPFTKVILEYYVSHNPNLVLMDEEIGELSNICIGMQLGATELCEKVNTIIAELNENGTLRDMEERWIKGNSKELVIPEKPSNPEGTLRVMTYAECEPFSYLGEGGKILGFDIELVYRIAYALNMDIEVTNSSFSALMPSLQSDKCDMILAILNETPERAEKILFSDPYLQSSIGIIVSADRYDKNILSIDMTAEEISKALNGAKVGATVGTVGGMLIEERYPQAELVQYDNNNDAIAALRNGKIDFAICGMSRVINYVKANEDVVYIDYPLTDNGLSLALAKGNDDLMIQINQLIAEYKQSGLLDEIYDRWYGAEIGKYEMPEIPVNADGKVLRVAVSASTEPLCFVYNNKICGYEPEIIERIAYELGMRAEYMDMNFSAEIAALQSGKADAALSMEATEERKKSVDFSDPYFKNPQTLLTIYAEEKEDLTLFEALYNFFADLDDRFVATFITEQRWKLVLDGLAVTIVISIASFILASILGALLLMMQTSKLAVLRIFASIYGKIISGTPMLVVLMLLYYIIFRTVDISGMVVAIIGFGLYSAVALAEVFKTGIDSVDKGEREAAAAIGFKPIETFTKIILPQAANRVFRLYKGQFVAIVKSTSIVGYIAIQDLTKVSDIIRSRTYDAFFPIIATGLIYFIITFICVKLMSVIEIKLDPKKRTRTLKGVVLK